MGMTADEFWHGEPRLAGAYRRADRMRQERADEQMWMQGRYVYEGMISVSPVMNALSKRHKPMEYVKKPYTAQYRDRAKDAAEREQMRMEAYMARLDRLIAKQQGGEQ